MGNKNGSHQLGRYVPPRLQSQSELHQSFLAFWGRGAFGGSQQPRSQGVRLVHPQSHRRCGNPQGLLGAGQLWTVLSSLGKDAALQRILAGDRPQEPVQNSAHVRNGREDTLGQEDIFFPPCTL